MDMTQIVRNRARELFEAGEVSAFAAWEAGRFEGVRSPMVVRKGEDVERLVCDDYCAPLIAKYALEHVSEGKVGLVARGCEARAVNRFVADHQLKRDQVYVLGLPCSGMKDPETGEELKPYRFAEVDRIEAMGREERRAYFDNVYSACIRCYACRNACPVCTCRECFVEQERVGWQGKEHNVDEARFYGLTRAFHVGDRCIECGECERVCPMHLPLMSLVHKQVRDIDRLFGPYEGGGLSDSGPDPLRTYKTDDIEEFM